MDLQEMAAAYSEENKVYGNRLLMGTGFHVAHDPDVPLDAAYEQVEAALEDAEEVAENADLQNLQKAMEGDFLAQNSLPPLYKDYLMTKQMKEFDSFLSRHEDKTIANEAVRTELDKHLMDPMFQTGLELMQSQAMKKGDKATSDNLGCAVSYMNSRVLENTMAPVDREALKGNDALYMGIGKNRQKQAILATQLMLAHLAGDNFKLNPKTAPVKNDATMADILSHGSRTMFALPAGRQGERLLEAITENKFGRNGKKGRDGAVFTRSAATHDVKIAPKVKGVEGLNRVPLTEKKVTVSLSDNYGMNIAIGGYGRAFGKSTENAWTLKDGGQDGHMYIKMEAPTDKKTGYMMIGIEGEEPHNHGHYGFSHTAQATKAPISPFGATKHTVGDAVNGRLVDLSGYDQDQLMSTVSSFKVRYTALLENAEIEIESRKKIEVINRRLAGAPMTVEALKGIMDELEVPASNLPQNMRNLAVDAPENPMQSATDDLVQGIKNREAKRFTDPGLSFFKDRLEANARYKLFGRWVKTKSSEMSKVQKALNAVTDSEITSMDDYQKKLKQLVDCCEKYVYNKHKKHNNRWEIVGDTMTAAGRELKRIEKLMDKEKKAAGLGTVKKEEEPVKLVNFKDLLNDRMKGMSEKANAVEPLRKNVAMSGKQKNAMQKGGKH